MKLEVYSVYDRTAMQYGHPFYVVNRAVAMRSFVDAFDRPGTMLSRHPDDFDLRRIAFFDDEKGTFEPVDNETIMTGAEVARMRVPPPAPVVEAADNPGGTA